MIEKRVSDDWIFLFHCRDMFLFQPNNILKVGTREEDLTALRLVSARVLQGN